MEKPAGSPEEDRASLKSNGKTPANDAVKGTLHRLQSFRTSIRRAVEKSPLSGVKGAKVTSEANNNALGSPTPPSPSPSAGSQVSSPLRTVEEDEANVTPQKNKPKHGKMESDVPGLAQSFIKKGDSIRRSIRLGTKKAKDKPPLNTTPQSSLEEKNEEIKTEVCEEMEETYTLPDIPHTPLSVMQINKLVETGMLEEAHLNLLAMRQEFQQERDQCGEDGTMELAKKEKDLNLLYGELRDKIRVIVRDFKKDLPGSLARIIQEEEKRSGEPGGLQGSWMDAWREAVTEGVQVQVNSVPLEQQNPSWLAVHLALLGKAIVEDLENAKQVLRWSYPPSFKVFSTYLKSYHKVVGQHLKKLEKPATEMKDLYALLDWINNRYKSEKIMGSESLQPDIKDESTDLQLEENFLKQLKEKYCSKVKEELGLSLERLINLENEDVWNNRMSPNKEDNYLLAKFPMDIWTAVESYIVNTGKIDCDLEKTVISSCLQELKQFPERFETQFKLHCSDLKPQPLWAEYHITYINSFTKLKEHMQKYTKVCPEEVDGFGTEGDRLIARFIQVLEEQFKEDVKMYLRRMLTRKWLTSDEDFDQLYSRTDLLSKHCAVMRPPHVQDFATHLHHHVVKEYVGQLMKNNYSCKNRKHEKAATKIRKQLEKLGVLFEDMKSSHMWLNQVGDDLSEIIGQKNKAEIKDHLEPMVKNCPDFRKKHLVAVLNFRGLLRGREHHLILQKFTELKKEKDSETSDKNRVLFHDMEVTVHTNCLSNLPFSCLRNHAAGQLG